MKDSCLFPLTLCLSMVLRKSKSVWSEMPPWTIRTFPSMTVATGRRLKTSWNSWRISRPCVCTQSHTVSNHMQNERLSCVHVWTLLYLVLLHDFFCEPISETTTHKHHRYRTYQYLIHSCLHLTWTLYFIPTLLLTPEVHDVVFMVPSVQVHVVGVKQKVGEQEHDHLDWLFPTIHKVTIKHIWSLRRG